MQRMNLHLALFEPVCQLAHGFVRGVVEMWRRAENLDAVDASASDFRQQAGSQRLVHEQISGEDALGRHFGKIAAGLVERSRPLKKTSIVNAKRGGVNTRLPRPHGAGREPRGVRPCLNQSRWLRLRRSNSASKTCGSRGPRVRAPRHPGKSARGRRYRATIAGES